MNHMGLSGRMLVGWNKDVTVHQIQHTDISIEIEFELLESGGRIWAIFVYASTNDRVRVEQWKELQDRKIQWGNRLIMGGDFNDIRNSEEKKGGRSRSVASCLGFRDFIKNMRMEEILFQEREVTWTNNWEEEGYIEARIDRLFGAGSWLLDHPNAVVTHVERQASTIAC